MRKFLIILVGLIFVLCTSCRDKYYEVWVYTWESNIGVSINASLGNTRDSLPNINEITNLQEITYSTCSFKDSLTNLHIKSLTLYVIDRDVADEIIKDKDHINYHKILNYTQGIHIYNLYNNYN